VYISFVSATPSHYVDAITNAHAHAHTFLGEDFLRQNVFFGASEAQVMNNSRIVPAEKVSDQTTYIRTDHQNRTPTAQHDNPSTTQNENK